MEGLILKHFGIACLALLLSVGAQAVDVPLEKTEKPTANTPDNQGPTSPSRVLPGEPSVHKNYWLPALEIPAFIALWNRIARVSFEGHDYDSTWATGWDHVTHGPWVIDHDAFNINQLGHPYQGTVYYGIARSCNLNFWESLVYSNVGSFIWETYGEITKPSINDQVASGTAGAFFGEPLYRMASLVLEGGNDNEKPGFWRELGAGILSPPSEINRLVFGDKYGPILEHRAPAYVAQVTVAGGWHTTVHTGASLSQVDRPMGEAAYSLGYGLPGKPGYKYMRPFDYFNFEVDGTYQHGHSYNDLMVRGLLVGQRYENGDSLRGVWGLYGTYDYLSPQIFRVSTTAPQVGTTFQKWLTHGIALQGTGLLGAGYGAAGTVLPAGQEEDYHYGLSPQSLVAMRLIFWDRCMLDATARGYMVTNIGSNRSPGADRLFRIDNAFLLRLFGPHHIGVHYIVAHRDARYSSGITARDQLFETFMISYSYLSDFHFGVVDWNHE